MEAATRTMAITFPVADAGFLRKQARSMGWQLVALPAQKKHKSAMPKVKMTEAEFRAKLKESSAQAAAGQYIEMRADETVEQFLNRILCTQSA